MSACLAFAFCCFPQSFDRIVATKTVKGKACLGWDEIDPVSDFIDALYSNPQELPDLIDFGLYLAYQSMVFYVEEIVIVGELRHRHASVDKEIEEFDEKGIIIHTGYHGVKGLADAIFHEMDLQSVIDFPFRTDGNPLPG